MIITTPIGRFKFTVLAQGVCNSSDILNYLLDGSMKHDNSGSLKNMDDIILHGRSIKELKAKGCLQKKGQNLGISPNIGGGV